VTFVIPSLARLATTCGDGILVTSHFGLSDCPAEHFALPDSATDGSYAVSSHVAKYYRKGDLAGSTVFQLYRGTKKDGLFEARLSSAAPCELEVAWGYVGRAANPDRSLEQENNDRAAIVARLLMQDAGVEVSPLARIERGRGGEKER
jgi:hypothetical protein